MDLTVLTGYLGLMIQMGLIGFLGIKGSRRGTPPRHGGRKPTAPVSWADAAPVTAPARIAEDPVDLAAADRRRSGRHARPHASRSDKLAGDGRDPERAWVPERHLRHRPYAS